MPRSTAPSTPKLPVFVPLVARGFELVFDRLTRLMLAGVHVRFAPGLASRLPADRPVLLMGNHVSNWDGFLYRALQRRLRPKAVTFSVMLERELRRLPLFRALGGLGIKPGSATSTAAALRATQALRRTRHDFFMSVFPQGAVYPASRRPLGFQEGVRAFARALAPVTIVPVAIRFEHPASLRAHAFILVGEPLHVGVGGEGCGPGGEPERDEVPSLAVLEGHVQALLETLDHELCEAGESAPERFGS
jgi:1-acyl-sn-glycerol-3-phosphate acyltransferase